MNEYLNVIRNHYADFSGRARRRQYWMFVLINAVISLVLSLPYAIATATAAINDAQVTDAPGGLVLISALLGGLYSLAVLVPTVAVTVRRLHDTGKSGWWYLLNFIPIGGLVIFVFTVLDSEARANKWGPNPKGQAGSRQPGADW